MRVNGWMVGGAAAAVILGAGSFVGCGDSGSGGSTGSGGATTGTESTTGTGSTTTTTTTSSTGAGAPCAPTASCPAADKACVGLVDNAGQTKFGLRIAELDVTAPASLANGIVGSTVAGAVTPQLEACNLKGTGTFSWLFQFDTTAQTLKTGGAKPVADPTAGYSFDDETIASGNGMFHVQPISYTGVTPDASGQFAIPTGQDALIPVFLDAGATQVLILPLKQLRIAMGTLSSNDNCIGQYNAAGLDPNNMCQPDGTTPLFLAGGSLDGHMTLEDSDTVVIAPIAQTLCVLLSGNPTMYGTQMGNVTVCKRDAMNKIVFQGDWCDATNMAGGCQDSVHLAANFAASSIKIND